MTPLTLAEIRATIIDATPAMTAALLRDLDWMIRDGFDVRPPAPDEGRYGKPEGDEPAGREPPDWMDRERLAADGVTTDAGAWLVSAGMDWGLDYGAFEVESLVGTVAEIERQAQSPAPAEGLDRPETVALKRLEEARVRSVHGPDCDADLRCDGCVSLPPAPAEGLDEERLARAIGIVGPVDKDDTVEADRAYAADIAREYAARDALVDPAPRVADECVGCLAESDEPHRPGCRYAPAPIPCPLCPHHMHLHDPEGRCGGGCH